ncbi:MAG: ribosome biogenesis GTP-binding protein YihA/YsxC [Desulfomonilaceae bacterium]|nr:ribosome biogenesis GTP-binding protein YihA/YsxC [Desulfomonilaceae bacterium]
MSSAVFIRAAEKKEDYPKGGLSEIAFAGRSNVGKSSAINTLLARRNLVRTSKTPGRTRMLNFFLINESFIFVDFPGYGYAAVPQAVKDKWGPMVETYLTSRKELAGVVLIVDSRHGFMESDRRLIEFLGHHGIVTVVVATKADKLNRGKIRDRQRAMTEDLGANVPVVPFSSHTGEGKNELWNQIKKLID